MRIQAIKLYDLKGEMLLSVEGYQAEIRMSGYPAGQYFLQIELKEGQLTRQLRLM